MPILQPLRLEVQCAHILDEIVLPTGELVVLELELDDLLLTLHDLLASVIDVRVLDVVALLKVDNELVLALDDETVLLDLLFVLVNLLTLVFVIVVKEVIVALDLDIDGIDVVILDREQILHLLDFFHGVFLTRLEVLHHRDQIAHIVAAGLL